MENEKVEVQEEKTKVVDFQLSEDLQEFVSFNADVKFASPDIKSEIKCLFPGTLMKVEKEIGSSTTILSVAEVTDELIKGMM